jgi:hypothetical protein
VGNYVVVNVSLFLLPEYYYEGIGIGRGFCFEQMEWVKQTFQIASLETRPALL